MHTYYGCSYSPRTNEGIDPDPMLCCGSLARGARKKLQTTSGNAVERALREVVDRRASCKARVVSES